MPWNSIQYAPSQHVQTDRQDKANRHILQICKHINRMWITVSDIGVFINDPTDGIQHSSQFSKMADSAANATIPFAVSGSPYVLVQHSTVNARTSLNI